MLIQNGKNQAHNHIKETEAKTNSSSIKDIKEKIITNITDKKTKRIKRNKIPFLNFQNSINHTQNTIKQKCFTIDDEIMHISRNKKAYNKIIQNEAINYIKKKYNLAEVYLKNNTLNNFLKNNNKYNKEISYLNINEFINLISKKNNNFNKNNFNIINNKLLSDFNKYNSFKYKKEQIEEEDEYKKYTVSYRDKMINDLNKKLNKDNIINESFNELQYDSQSINMIDNLNQNQTEKKSNIKCIKEYKIKKVKYKINIENERYMKNSEEKIIINNTNNKTIINNLDKNKTKDIKNRFKIIKKNNSKNKKSYLLINDLLSNKMIKRKSLTFNDNINKYNCYNQSLRKNHKNKNYFKNKENIVNSETNKNKTKDYLNKGLESHSLKKITTNKNQILSGNIKKRGCIIKNDNINQLTCKNSFTNILDKSTKNIKSESFNNKYKDKINNNRKMVFYNIKNLVINTGKNNFINRTIIKNNKFLKQSNLIKDKNNKDINKTQNTPNLTYNNNNFINNNIYCRIIKNKAKRKIKFINQIIASPLTKYKKINLKDNNKYKFINLTSVDSVLKNDNENTYISFNSNNYNNNKSQKVASINEKIYNTIEERDKRIIFKKKL